jgi:hypothetical protein
MRNKKGGNYLNQLQLNIAAATYSSDPNGCMRQVIGMLDAYRRQFLRKANGRYMNDEHSLTETFDTTLWKSLEKYDKLQDFLPFFFSNLKRANVSRIRKGGAAKVTAEVYDGISEDGSSMLDTYEDPDNFEETVQKKRDQRQLISILLANADELTKRICCNRPMYDTNLSLAKAIGVHHSAVSRTFTKIKNQFDANRFGPLSDYITA